MLSYLMGKFIDETGNVYGRWTVMRKGERDKTGRFRWLCVCVCGIKKEVDGRLLRKGQSQSCGCLMVERVKKANTTHGMSKTKLYQHWIDMMRRCYHKGRKEYRNYGARGIEVCDRWHTFKNFYKDMKDSWMSGLTIERVDNNKGYCLDNCTWVELREQPKNRRIVRPVRNSLGDVYSSQREASRMTGINNSSINQALKGQICSAGKTKSKRKIFWEYAD